MPNRIVREAILSSESVSALSWAEEVFYRRLMSIVDDYGRHEANPQLIRARCYPLQTDAVKAKDVSAWMEACQKAAILTVYSSGGKTYLQINKFQQQTRTASKCPAPDSECSQMIANEHLVVSVVGVVSEGVVDVPRKRGKQPKVAMPESFGISERVRSWAVEKGYHSLEARLEHFRGKCKANSYAYADWDEAFMGAIRDDWAKIASKTATSVVQGKTKEQALAPSETPEERRRAQIWQDFHYDQITAAERDQKLAHLGPVTASNDGVLV